MEQERKLQGMSLEEQFEEQKRKLLAAQERQMKAMAAWKEKELREARSGLALQSLLFSLIFHSLIRSGS